MKVTHNISTPKIQWESDKTVNTPLAVFQYSFKQYMMPSLFEPVKATNRHFGESEKD